MSKPQYILEIEQNTGLKCIPVPKKEATMLCQQYWLVSPTGFKLFMVGSHCDDIIGMVSSPELYSLQGISENIRHARMRTN